MSRPARAMPTRGSLEQMPSLQIPGQWRQVDATATMYVDRSDSDRSRDMPSPMSTPLSGSTQYWTPRTPSGGPWLVTPIATPYLSAPLAPPPYSTNSSEISPAPKSAPGRYGYNSNERYETTDPFRDAVTPIPGTMASRGHNASPQHSPTEYKSHIRTHRCARPESEESCTVRTDSQASELSHQSAGLGKRLVSYLKGCFHRRPIRSEDLDFIEPTHWTDGT